MTRKPQREQLPGNIFLRTSPELIDKIDTLALATDRSRSGMTRYLIKLGLMQLEGTSTTPTTVTAVGKGIDLGVGNPSS